MWKCIFRGLDHSGSQPFNYIYDSIVNINYIALRCTRNGNLNSPPPIGNMFWSYLMWLFCVKVHCKLLWIRSLMEQCSTVQSPQPLVTSLEGQWPPTPVLTAMSWWERRTGHVLWMEHGQELSHSAQVVLHISCFDVCIFICWTLWLSWSCDFLQDICISWGWWC